MMTEDYILRMIRDMGRMLAKILNLETENPYVPREETRVQLAEVPSLAEDLLQMADRGEINAAEDRLFEELDFSDPQAFSGALAFYEHLNGFSDDRLRLCGYSRDEIFEGLRDCAAKFGVDKTLLDAFQP